MSHKDIRFISGMHRSGTTWVGQVVQHALPQSVIHEPFNADIGLSDVTRWYYGPADAEHVTQLVRGLRDGKLGYRRRRRTDGILKGAVRQIVGSAYDRDLRLAHRGNNFAIVLKDPFLLRVGATLAKTFEAKGVILVRHPAALVHSLRGMNWPIPNFDGQMPLHHSNDPEVQFAFALGWFWAKLYRDALDSIAAHPKHLLLIKHEDLCVRPLETGERVLKHMDILSNAAARDFLLASTSGEAGQIEGNALHQMNRSGIALADAWRNSLSPDEIAAVAQGAGALLAQIYPQNHD